MSPIPGIRQRNGEADNEKRIAQAVEARVEKVKDIEGDEVVIDGLIYSFEGFDHPGGEIYRMFGGEDVSVFYKMIHPHHNARNLEKMKVVGKASDWKPEYKFDTPFERELKQEVFKMVKRGREFATPGWFGRAAFYICLMSYFQYRWSWEGATWTLAILLGVSQALIGLNVQHDSNHGSISRKHYLNDFFGFAVAAIGGDRWMWMQNHWTHHCYTNNELKDGDAVAGEPFFAFHDYPIDSPNRKWWHRFQGVFFIFFLSFSWLITVFQTPFMKWKNPFIDERRIVAWAMKALYVYLNIIRPFTLAGGFSFTTLAQVWLMGASWSMTLAPLFVLSHNFEGADRDPLKSVKDSNEPVCWYKSQVETSCTYGGVIAGCITGGLNHQVEHHLFPRMSSAWYPHIAPKVQEICAKHGVRYTYYPYIWENIASTFKYMHKTGIGANWREYLTPLDN